MTFYAVFTFFKSAWKKYDWNCSYMMYEEVDLWMTWGLPVQGFGHGLLWGYILYIRAAIEDGRYVRRREVKEREKGRGGGGIIFCRSHKQIGRHWHEKGETTRPELGTKRADTCYCNRLCSAWSGRIYASISHRLIDEQIDIFRLIKSTTQSITKSCISIQK